MKIVIIGGVAAGASAAARARRLNENAEIVILERGRYVSFANCGLPYHIGGVIKDRENLLLHTPQSLNASLNLDVRTGHEVIAIDRANRTVTVREIGNSRNYTEAYDKLVLCPGAGPVKPLRVEREAAGSPGRSPPGSSSPPGPGRHPGAATQQARLRQGRIQGTFEALELRGR